MKSDNVLKILKLLKSNKLKYLLGIILLIPFIYYAGLNSLKNLVKPVWGYIFLSFCFTILAYYLDSYRWGIITNEITQRKVCSYKEYFIIFASSMSISQFISQTGGMFILRPIILKKKYGLSYRFSYISIIIEKSADFFFLIIFLLNSLIFFFIHDIKVTILTLFSSLILGYFLYVNYGFIFEKIAYYTLRKIEKFRKKREDIKLSEIQLVNLNTFHSFFKVAIISILRIFAYSLRIFFLVKGINLAIHYLIILFGIPIAQIALIFAITPGSIGILEGGWLGVLKIANIPKEIIGKFLVGQRFYLIIFNLLILVLYFSLFKKISSIYEYKYYKK